MAMVPDEQGVFYVLIVSGGPGSGEFTYDASGNLRSANVGQVTTDPVQGITCQQGFSTFNGHGAVINLLSTAVGAFFQYQDLGTSSQGSMILAVASNAGTDPVTGAGYGAGLTGVDPAFADSITTVGANIGLFQLAYTIAAKIAAFAGGGAVAPRLQVDAPEQSHAGHLQLQALGSSPDGSRPAQLLIGSFSGSGALAATTTALVEVQGNIAASLVKAIVSSALEIWHVVGAAGQPAFVNNFTAGGTAPRFQLEPIGGGRVRLSGAVNTGANTLANTTIFTLPAGYVPSRAFSFTTPNNVTAFTLGSASIGVTTGGAVQLVPAGTAGKFVLLDGICFELD